MPTTTVKLSTETLDRIRALGGGTFEETIIEALDGLEADRFWAQAEAATKWRGALPGTQRQFLAKRDSEVDASFGGNE
jgi:hypothetical protein